MQFVTRNKIKSKTKKTTGQSADYYKELISIPKIRTLIVIILAMNLLIRILPKESAPAKAPIDIVLKKVFINFKIMLTIN